MRARDGIFSEGKSRALRGSLLSAVLFEGRTGLSRNRSQERDLPRWQEPTSRPTVTFQAHQTPEPQHTPTPPVPPPKPPGPEIDPPDVKDPPSPATDPVPVREPPVVPTPVMDQPIFH